MPSSPQHPAPTPRGFPGADAEDPVPHREEFRRRPPESLHGPTHGVVALPLRMAWSGMETVRSHPQTSTSSTGHQNERHRKSAGQQHQQRKWDSRPRCTTGVMGATRELMAPSPAAPVRIQGGRVYGALVLGSAV
ncbi:hypothetical protein C0216_08015 [Streptomyces globosus]|uniref:Uncharacterized protein n=1 Tax=Streptomyces globosus TaxID=68209 RepID=A0A344TXP7_9ACTN|nr:hypothetical protein C0216_08015 [Streptomyces globosus]